MTETNYIIETIIETAKEVVTEAIAAGTEHKDIFNFLVSKFGPQNARLILASIALDLGMKTAADNYLNSFE